MVRPALQEEDLRRAGELGDEALRPEFARDEKAFGLISSEILKSLAQSWMVASLPTSRRGI